MAQYPTTSNDKQYVKYGVNIAYKLCTHIQTAK